MESDVSPEPQRDPLAKRIKRHVFNASFKLLHDAFTHGPLSDEIKASAISQGLHSASLAAKEANKKAGNIRRTALEIGHAPESKGQSDIMTADFAHLKNPSESYQASTHTQDTQ